MESITNKTKNIINKVRKRVILKILLNSGYPYATAIIALRELEDDISMVKDISLLKKIILYRKGYFSERLKCYKINEENSLNNYMPELKYYKLHPINGIYSKWIDDKLTIRYIFNSYSRYLPKYYFQILNKRIIRLIDCPKMYTSDISGIMNLLRDKGILAVKLLMGSWGDGFYKFTYSDNLYTINDEEITEQELVKKIASLENYLITEYVVLCEEIRRIFPSGSTPVRVMVINDENGHRIIVGFIRFGTNSTGITTSTGGIFCGIDIDDGTIFNPCQYDEDLNVVDTPIHPDTGVEIKGKIKYWDNMKELLMQISADFPQLCYMGYDIIFTDDSFKIIEINSLPGLEHTQCFYPALKNDDDRKFYSKFFNAQNMKL